MKSDRFLRSVSLGLLVLAFVFGMVTRVISVPVKSTETINRYLFTLDDIDLKVGDKVGAATLLGVVTESYTGLQFKTENCSDPITVMPEPLLEYPDSQIDDVRFLKANTEVKDVYLGQIIEHFSTMARTIALITKLIRNKIFLQKRSVKQEVVLHIYDSKSCQIDPKTTLALADTELAVLEKIPR